jgi:5,10-methylenetetrahydrofolate reductase
LVVINQGPLAPDERLEPATGFLVAAPLTPFRDTAGRLEAKCAAGAGLFQSNIVYDVDRFAEWFTPLVDAGAIGDAPVLVGIAPPRSMRMLEYMHERIPGVEADDETFARMRGLTGERAKAAGIGIAVDTIERLREVPGVRGVHIMAPGWESEAVPRIAESTALLVC